MTLQKKKLQTSSRPTFPKHLQRNLQNSHSNIPSNLRSVMQSAPTKPDIKKTYTRTLHNHTISDYMNRSHHTKKTTYM